MKIYHKNEKSSPLNIPIFCYFHFCNITKVQKPTSTGSGRERVVILGSGWAGTLFMKNLDPTKYAVSLVSPRNHFLFTPMLPGASVGTVSYNSICEPIRPLAMKKNARYYQAEATEIDLANKTIHCRTELDQEFNMPYDKLVVACGYQAYAHY